MPGPTGKWYCTILLWTSNDTECGVVGDGPNRWQKGVPCSRATRPNLVWGDTPEDPAAFIYWGAPSTLYFLDEPLAFRFRLSRFPSSRFIPRVWDISLLLNGITLSLHLLSRTSTPFPSASALTPPTQDECECCSEVGEKAVANRGPVRRL